MSTNLRKYKMYNFLLVAVLRRVLYFASWLTQALLKSVCYFLFCLRLLNVRGNADAIYSKEI